MESSQHLHDAICDLFVLLHHLHCIHCTHWWQDEAMGYFFFFFSSYTEQQTHGCESSSRWRRRWKTKSRSNQQLSINTVWGRFLHGHTHCLMLTLHCSLTFVIASNVRVLTFVMVSWVEFWYRCKRFSQLCSTLPSPYKRCCVSINSPKALGQASLSKAAQQTQKEKKRHRDTTNNSASPLALPCWIQGNKVC